MAAHSWTHSSQPITPTWVGEMIMRPHPQLGSDWQLMVARGRRKSFHFRGIAYALEGSTNWISGLFRRGGGGGSSQLPGRKGVQRVYTGLYHGLVSSSIKMSSHLVTRGGDCPVALRHTGKHRQWHHPIIISASHLAHFPGFHTIMIGLELWFSLTSYWIFL